MIFDKQTILHTLKAHNQSPDYHFWKDANNHYRMINEKMAKDFGHKSAYVSFDGITDYDHKCKAVELADKFIMYDNLVMTNGKPMTLIELLINSDDELRLYYVRKTPILDDKGNSIGINGYIVDSTNCPLIRSALPMLSENSEIKSSSSKKTKQIIHQLKSTYDEFKLTPRESEALYYLMRGKTAKETAQRLNIHFKTVEKHHENIRTKLNCNSRSEVIEKAINSGAALIIPTSLFNL